jgi:hypothetical protein
VSLALVATGLVVAALVPRARPAAAGAAAAAIVAALGAMAGDAGAGLVAVAAAFVLAGVGMQAVVRAVATARVPFAAASAMMIVVLELAFPAVALDEATYAVDDRDKTAGAPWAEETFGALAARPVVAVRGEASWRRVLAATATGEMRGDALLLPFDDLSTRAAVRALSREPALAAVFHDVALEGRPGEFALAQLATTRTLALPFAPSDDRSLARHLVPAGAVDRFLPEPHGTSDRRRALEAFLPGRERLARAIAAPRGDPTLAAATATLLRARVLGLAAANDRELMPRALDDLRAFAPTDEVAAEVTRRVILSRTPIDVTTLPTAPR